MNPRLCTDLKLPLELLHALRAEGRRPGETIAFLVTSSLDGRPNVSVQPFTDIVVVNGEEYVLMPDLFALKTKINLNENRRAILSIARPSSLSPWVVEGACNVIQWGHPANYRFRELRAGDVLDRWGDWAAVERLEDLESAARPAVIAQRGVIVLHAARVARLARPEPQVGSERRAVA